MKNLKIFIVLAGFLSHTIQAQKLEIHQLAGDFYVYTTYHDYDGKPFPSNSMYLVTDDGVILFDTPWDEAQCQPLLDSIEKRHNKKVMLCLVTHFHDDRTAGLDFLKSKGIKTWSTKQTYELGKAHGIPGHFSWADKNSLEHTLKLLQPHR
ncbi:MAG TPA: MBL fold metallo-hydrolase [Flavobacterium sp.]|nr:MBL fold metallo-hydrolase [Flavobacterium sp.]